MRKTILEPVNHKRQFESVSVRAYELYLNVIPSLSNMFLNIDKFNVCLFY